MIRRTVSKAEAVDGYPAIESATLHVSGTIPAVSHRAKLPAYERMRLDFFDEEARTIMLVLDQLPGGTRAALLVRMLQAQKCIYTIQLPGLPPGLEEKGPTR